MKRRLVLMKLKRVAFSPHLMDTKIGGCFVVVIAVAGAFDGCPSRSELGATEQKYQISQLLHE